VVAGTFAADAVTKNVTYRDIPSGWMAVDIGPASTIVFEEALEDAKTIIWNGPMGAFEIDAFARGTLALCHSVASAHALSIVGGDDSNAAVKKNQAKNEIFLISLLEEAFFLNLWKKKHFQE